MRLAWGEVSFLLPLGATTEDLAALRASGQLLAASVLLVPEGGRAGALDRGLAEAVNPWAAVISVGVDGPAAKTLEALEGYPVMRTDRNGWVTFATDGERLWAEVERLASPPESSRP
jgi:beta-lactamase superfamily II metal-dependent hydrolase